MDSVTQTGIIPAENFVSPLQSSSACPVADLPIPASRSQNCQAGQLSLHPTHNSQAPAHSAIPKPFFCICVWAQKLMLQFLKGHWSDHIGKSTNTSMKTKEIFIIYQSKYLVIVGISHKLSDWEKFCFTV